MAKNELYEILTELVEILVDVIYEQATREQSGTFWLKDKMDYIKLLKEKIETYKSETETPVYIKKIYD